MEPYRIFQCQSAFLLYANKTTLSLKIQIQDNWRAGDAAAQHIGASMLRCNTVSRAVRRADPYGASAVPRCG
ncbi:MAG: hypothetical protein WA191_23695 [Telluria sp.]|nr:hypothetical protein [Telluria sp.]